MKRTLLASTIALMLGSSASHADIAVTNMFVEGAGSFAASGSLTNAGDGHVSSIDLFFGSAWTLDQQTTFMDTTGSWAGTSAQGAFNYDAEIAAMTASQFAIGSYWNWNGNNEIAHLDIYECVASVCTSVGAPHQNGPAQGTVLNFSGTGSASVVPIPSAAWLFGSGLLGLVGIARRKKA